MLSHLEEVKASCYLDIISLTVIEPTQDNYEKSYRLIRERINEESFLPNLSLYLDKIDSIEEHIRAKRIFEEWENYREVYERETIKDFMGMTVELLTFLGEGFVSGALREAL